MSTIIRDILRFFLGKKKMKRFDSPAARKDLEDRGIKYTPMTQEYDVQTGQFKFFEKKKEE